MVSHGVEFQFNTFDLHVCCSDIGQVNRHNIVIPLDLEILVVCNVTPYFYFL